MAKKNGRVKIDNIPAPKKPARSLFTNSAGKTYPIIGMSPYTLDQIKIDMIERWRLDGHPLPMTPPPVPTYEVETVGGGKETFEMDKESLETDEEKVKWAEYQLALDEYNKTQSVFEAECNLEIFKEVIHVVECDPRQDKDWLDWCEYKKMNLPTNSFELKELYVKTQVVRSVSDIPRLMTAVMVVSEIASEEAARVMEASFQRHLFAALRPAHTAQ